MTRTLASWLRTHALLIAGLSATVAIWIVSGLTSFAVWLALAAIAAPIIGQAIATDDAFDLDLDEPDEPCSDYNDREDHHP